MLDNCQPLLIEKEGLFIQFIAPFELSCYKLFDYILAEQISSESESRYFEEQKDFSWLGVSMAGNPLSGRLAVIFMIQYLISLFL